ncbi:hypothetical protein OPT61_g4435 [Boeremia exigua]|uniref:Uncharacterized protein n=1 Tax=Boeremia exigua TaxID=749465 RepID=A0ACC2IE65_9PLEO|nr:hypothetical protein OPT61_g4435 [Boeremia exigua]
MFGVLHWNFNNGEGKEVTFVQRPHGSASLDKVRACSHCRVRCKAKSGDTCSRCKRLGQQCKFTLEVCKEDQYLQGVVSTPKHGEVVSLNSHEPPSVSLFPLEDDPQIAVNGRWMAGELLEGHTSVRSEQATMANQIHQSPGDRDAPKHSPDQTPPATATSWDEFSAWTTCSGHEISQMAPSIVHSEDCSTVNTDFNTKPVSSQNSTTGSETSLNQCTSAQSSCLTASVLAVEHFEANSMHNTQLDSILASQKKAVKCCRSMTTCIRCMAKRENLVMLVFMIEKLVKGCGCIVALLGWLEFDNTLPLPGALPSSPVYIASSNAASNNKHSDTAAMSTPSATLWNRRTCSAASVDSEPTPTWRNLLIGDYEVNSSVEWEYVVRSLISLQFKALLQLLGEIKIIGGKDLGDAQILSLTQAEIRIKDYERDVLT